MISYKSSGSYSTFVLHVIDWFSFTFTGFNPTPSNQLCLSAEKNKKNNTAKILDSLSENFEELMSHLMVQWMHYS